MRSPRQPVSFVRIAVLAIVVLMVVPILVTVLVGGYRNLVVEPAQSAAASASHERQQVLQTALAVLCNSGTPIPGAQPYGGDRHPAVLVDPRNSIPSLYSREVIGWQPEDASLVQLVGCLSSAPSPSQIDTCRYDVIGDLPLFWEPDVLTVVEARTGHVVATDPVSNSNPPRCPESLDPRNVPTRLNTSGDGWQNPEAWTLLAQYAQEGDCPIVAAAVVGRIAGFDAVAQQAGAGFCAFEHDGSSVLDTSGIWVRSSPQDGVATALATSFPSQDPRTVSGHQAVWRQADFPSGQELLVDLGDHSLSIVIIEGTWTLDPTEAWPVAEGIAQAAIGK